MNPTLLHRISEIEKEMDGELDLRAVATQPLSEANWADPARYDFAPLGVESALPPSFTAPPQAKKPREIDWQLVGVYAAAAVCLIWCLLLSTMPLTR